MKILLTIAALVVLAVPAAFAAPPTGSDSKNAAKACKAERGTAADTVEAFNAKWGKNANKKNAFGKCVSAKAKAKGEKDEKDEAKEDEEKKDAEAAKKCRAERGTAADKVEAFHEKYGTNKNKKNAFGKCVSKHSKSG